MIFWELLIPEMYESHSDYDVRGECYLGWLEHWDRRFESSSRNRYSPRLLCVLILERYNSLTLYLSSMEPQVKSLVSPYEVWAQSDTEQIFLLELQYPPSPTNCHSINAPYSYISQRGGAVGQLETTVARGCLILLLYINGDSGFLSIWTLSIV